MESSKTIWSKKSIESFVGIGIESAENVVSNPNPQSETASGNPPSGLNTSVVASSSEADTPPPPPPPTPARVSPNANATTEGKSADETILSSHATVAGFHKKNENPPPPPSGEDFWSKVTSAFQTPNPQTVSDVYKKGVVNILRSESIGEYTMPWEEYARMVVPNLGENYPLNQRGTKYARLLAKQFNIWYLAVPMTYIIVLNWWYFWNYTEFTFDFRSLIDSLPAFKWVCEPFLYSVEFVNYYIAGVRLDANISENWRNRFRSMWNNRPITFTIFYAMVAGLLTCVPGFTTVSEFLASILLGEPSVFARIMPILGIFFFFYITFKPTRLLEYYMNYQNIFIIIISMILHFIMSAVVAGFFGPALLGMYLYVISYCAMMIFTFPGLGSILSWPWIMLREFLRIYHDLSEAPVSDPETKNIFGKVGNFLFQEFQNLFILFLICLPILIINLKEVVENTKENPAFMLFMFALNFSAILMVSGGMEITLHKLYKIIVDILTSLATFSAELPMKGIEEADI